MRIERVSTRAFEAPLSRPYTIAFQTTDRVRIAVVEIRTTGGLVAVGTATPEPAITGETFEATLEALDPERLDWLLGRDARTALALCRELLGRLPREPAARAALDMALHDLWARALGLPLVEVLGRAHRALPTSVTIGIKPVRETLDEAEEHVGKGFRVLKIKIGRDVREDAERLLRLRERFGDGIALRADANQGYGADELLWFCEATAACGLELLEQPLPAGETDGLLRLPAGRRRHIAADESLHDVRDAWRLVQEPRPFGIFNVKLMKCGGIHEALRISALAEAAGVELMWGCMDESVAGIAAALHAALSSPATRYLDLDGSLDLARDCARGGFLLKDGVLTVGPGHGLGAEPA